MSMVNFLFMSTKTQPTDYNVMYVLIDFFLFLLCAAKLNVCPGAAQCIKVLAPNVFRFRLVPFPLNSNCV